MLCERKTRFLDGGTQGTNEGQGTNNIKTRKLNPLTLCYLQSSLLSAPRNKPPRHWIILPQEILPAKTLKIQHQRLPQKELSQSPTEKPHKPTQELKIKILVFNSETQVDSQELLLFLAPYQTGNRETKTEVNSNFKLSIGKKKAIYLINILKMTRY